MTFLSKDYYKVENELILDLALIPRIAVKGQDYVIHYIINSLCIISTHCDWLITKHLVYMQYYYFNFFYLGICASDTKP